MSEPIYVNNMPIYVLNREGRDDCMVPIQAGMDGVDDCVVPIAMTSEAERPLLSCECVPAVVCPSHRAEPTPADQAQAQRLIDDWLQWLAKDVALALAAARAEGIASTWKQGLSFELEHEALIAHLTQERDALLARVAAVEAALQTIQAAVLQAELAEERRRGRASGHVKPERPERIE